MTQIMGAGLNLLGVPNWGSFVNWCLSFPLTSSFPLLLRLLLTGACLPLWFTETKLLWCQASYWKCVNMDCCCLYKVRSELYSLLSKLYIIWPLSGFLFLFFVTSLFPKVSTQTVKSSLAYFSQYAVSYLWIFTHTFIGAWRVSSPDLWYETLTITF